MGVLLLLLLPRSGSSAGRMPLHIPTHRSRAVCVCEVRIGMRDGNGRQAINSVPANLGFGGFVEQLKPSWCCHPRTDLCCFPSSKALNRTAVGPLHPILRLSMTQAPPANHVLPAEPGASLGALWWSPADTLAPSIRFLTSIQQHHNAIDIYVADTAITGHAGPDTSHRYRISGTNITTQWPKGPALTL